MPNLTTQHKLGILQGVMVQQPIQFCPLCRGVAVLVLHGDAVDGKGSAILEPGFHPVDVHIVAARKQFHHSSIDCTGVEDVLDVTMAQRSELDYLIYNDPLGYADLILNGDPEEYLKNVTGSHGLED